MSLPSLSRLHSLVLHHTMLKPMVRLSPRKVATMPQCMELLPSLPSIVSSSSSLYHGESASGASGSPPATITRAPHHRRHTLVKNQCQVFIPKHWGGPAPLSGQWDDLLDLLSKFMLMIPFTKTTPPSPTNSGEPLYSPVPKTESLRRARAPRAPLSLLAAGWPGSARRLPVTTMVMPWWFPLLMLGQSQAIQFWPMCTVGFPIFHLI
jgi:hypothetical protein